MIATIWSKVRPRLSKISNPLHRLGVTLPQTISHDGFNQTALLGQASRGKLDGNFVSLTAQQFSEGALFEIKLVVGNIVVYQCRVETHKDINDETNAVAFTKSILAQLKRGKVDSPWMKLFSQLKTM